MGCRSRYDGDVNIAKRVIADLPTYFPGATKAEVAGCAAAGPNATARPRLPPPSVAPLLRARRAPRAPHARVLAQAALSRARAVFWWQGDKDSRDEGLSTHYEANLVQLIKQLRSEFNAPHAKFVTASLGQTVKGATDGGGKILDAMLAVDGGSGKYPEFKGNVAAVYTHPLDRKSVV